MQLSFIVSRVLHAVLQSEGQEDSSSTQPCLGKWCRISHTDHLHITHHKPSRCDWFLKSTYSSL